MATGLPGPAALRFDTRLPDAGALTIRKVAVLAGRRADRSPSTRRRSRATAAHGWARLRCRDAGSGSEVTFRRRGGAAAYRGTVRIRRQPLAVPDAAETPLVVDLAAPGWRPRSAEIGTCTTQLRRRVAHFTCRGA